MNIKESLLKMHNKEDDNSKDDDMEFFFKPKKKNKILFISDHQLAPSGVGIQARVLIQGLLETGRYTFRCIGGAIKHTDYNPIKVNDDFIIIPVDGFGTKEMIRKILITEKPDAIFIFTDPRQFIWLWEMEDEVHNVCPIVYWHVWDNDPYPAFNKPWYDGTDLINCLSWKTYEMIKPKYPEKTNYIPHAFPKQMYFPIEKNQIKQISMQQFGPKHDWFKILWVNRNAHRKVPNDLLDCWQRFLVKLEEKHGHRKAVLIMHTDPKDQEGPDIITVSQELKINENVWFSVEKLQFEQVNVLHNVVDGVINISKAEGFGLTTLISLQVGKPIIALKTGGETRQVEDWRDGSQHGVALEPVKRLLVGSQQVPYIYEDFADTEETVDAFMKLYEMTEEEKEVMKQKCIDYVDFEFNYNDMVSKWDQTLQACIDDYKTNNRSFEKRWTLEEIVSPGTRTYQPIAPQAAQTNNNNVPSALKKTEGFSVPTVMSPIDNPSSLAAQALINKEEFKAVQRRK